MSTRRLIAAAVLALGLGACGADPGAAPDAGIDRIGLARERAWIPEGEAEAVILALHGFNDYSRAFADFGEAAEGAGIAVHAYDQRGFGANGDAGFWAGTGTLTADVARRVADLRDRYPERPLYLLGESMGGAIAIAALTARDDIEIDGLILSAPAAWGGEYMSALYRATLWFAVRLAPDLRLTGEGLDRRPSDNIEMLRALGRDPLVIKETRVAAIGGLVELMDLAYAAAPRLDLPVLILGGERDEIVPPELFPALMERIEAERCTGIIYPEGWHMLLRDRQRATVHADVLAWTRGLEAPSGLARPCGEAVTRDATWQK